jgi:hypothetical protein
MLVDWFDNSGAPYSDAVEAGDRRKIRSAR